MPKLAGRVQKFVDKQEPNAEGGGGFVVIEEPQVLGALAEVREEEGDFGTQWVVSWDKLTSLSGKEYPGKLTLWMNIPGSSKAPAGWKVIRGGQDVTETKSAAEIQDLWTEQITKQAARVHALFAVPGYTTDSDTDELIGELYLLDIGTRPRKDSPGQKVNRVFGFRSPKEATGDGGFAEGGEAGKATDDDEF